MAQTTQRPSVIVTEPDRCHEKITVDKKSGTTICILIDPEIDHCPVKVQTFSSRDGYSEEGISYPQYDQTVVVLAGQIKIWTRGIPATTLSEGCAFHVPSGRTYNLEVYPQSKMHCTFSAKTARLI